LAAALRSRGQQTKANAVSTRVTVKGRITLPKAVREAAGIRPGDVVSVRARPEGGVVVEREHATPDQAEYRRRIEDMARRRPFQGYTTVELMKLTRGEE
jgi:AbrB family looped-hinge helix DNA binding protein